MWRRSSRCADNNCVEVAFTKSTRSADSANCVEVGRCCGDVLVRDSKDPDGPRLNFSPEAWAAFLVGIRAGEFECGDA